MPIQPPPVLPLSAVLQALHPGLAKARSCSARSVCLPLGAGLVDLRAPTRFARAGLLRFPIRCIPNGFPALEKGRNPLFVNICGRQKIFKNVFLLWSHRHTLEIEQ